ncbi:hypothetical protein BG011_004227 [Mortierella polycephala]|uniref:Uncharacterized protein n=1 Tax=Mortierella polycephala TaxID=41804 RepID=A0A9P6Q1M7_9FUNG|nr:hypothetical protein BG011_004227 [Mortierella polycephala]
MSCTIILSSNEVCDEFLRQLANHVILVNELHLTLSWKLGKSQLRALAKVLAQTNLRLLTLDMNNADEHRVTHHKVPKYTSYCALMELILNRKIQKLVLKRLNYFGSPTRDFPEG